MDHAPAEDVLGFAQFCSNQSLVWLMQTCSTFRCLLREERIRRAECMVLSYQELLRDPKREKKKIFQQMVPWLKQAVFLAHKISEANNEGPGAQPQHFKLAVALVDLGVCVHRFC